MTLEANQPLNYSTKLRLMNKKKKKRNVTTHLIKNTTVDFIIRYDTWNKE